MKEEWKWIESYEGLYQVSNLGRIKRWYKTNPKRLKHKSPFRIIGSCINPDGYHVVGLSKNSKSKNYVVGKIVLITFKPTTNNDLQMNHIDGNKLNDRVDNLEWVTIKENIYHAFRIGLCDHRMGETLHLSKLTESDIKQIRKLYEKSDKKLSDHKRLVQIAKQFPVGHGTIRQIVKRETWKHIK